MEQSNTVLNRATVRFLIVEDHPLFLEGLSFALKKLPGTTHLCTVGSSQEAKDVLNSQTDFDLILLDLNLPDGQGFSLLRFLQLKKLFIPVAIISASEEASDVNASLAAGAAGFISKANNSEGIVAAVQKIMEGEQCLPDFYERTHSTEIPPLSLNLTPRQQEVLELLAEGLPNKRICQRLALTEHTVKTHLKMLFQLLDVHNRTECVQKAIKLRLLIT